MMKYIKNLIFYSVAFVESFTNFLCSFLGYYPKLSWSVDFLVMTELKRVKSEIYSRDQHKVIKNMEAKQLVETAKSYEQDS